MNLSYRNLTKTQTSFLFSMMYYGLTLTYFGFLLTALTVKTGFSWIQILFDLSAALILSALTLVFKKPKRAMVILTMGLITLYASQIYYYYFFDTFYIVYSLMNAGMVVKSFYREIFQLITHHLDVLIYLNVPLILLFFFRKQVKLRSLKLRTMGTVFLSGILFYGSTLFGITLMDPKEPVYDAFVYHPDVIDSIKSLGLMTTITVDLTRFVRDSIGLTNASKAPDAVDEENPEPSVDLPNVLDIPFATLIANETDPVLRSLHEYYSNRSPSRQNAMTGLYKDYNLIVITAETFSRWAVREDITPTLYKLVHEGYTFTDFYTPLYTVSTSDGEYMGFTGMLPKFGVWSMKTSAENDMGFVLGHQLKDLGYATYAFHNNDFTYYRRDLSHPNLGYTYLGVGNGLTNTGEWPQSDLDMMKETIPMFIDEDRFHVYYMTVSGHSNYYWESNAQSRKNQALVRKLPYIQYVKGYLAAQIELDKALAYLLDELEKAGKLDKTLIVLSADHYPYNFFVETLTNLNDGVPVDYVFDVHRSPLILYTPGIPPTIITKPASSLDLLPTIDNLMGIPYDSRLLMGTDLFSTSETMVIFKDHSFITPRGRYNAVTQTFTFVEGYDEDPDYVDRMIKVVDAKFYYSQKFLETDYYSIIREALSK